MLGEGGGGIDEPGLVRLVVDEGEAGGESPFLGVGPGGLAVGAFAAGLGESGILCGAEGDDSHRFRLDCEEEMKGRSYV